MPKKGGTRGYFLPGTVPAEYSQGIHPFGQSCMRRVVQNHVYVYGKPEEVERGSEG